MPANALATRVDPLVDHVVGVLEPLADRQEAERRQPCRSAFGVRQLVGRDLLVEELVVRHVVVERLR